MSVVEFNRTSGDPYASFIDVETMLKPWLEIPASDTSLDFQLHIIADEVSYRCQKFIGSPIAPLTYGPDDGLGKFDGGGGLYSSYIMLPRVPVLEVISVIEYQGQTPVELTEITNPAGSGPAGATDGFQLNYRTGRMTRVLGGLWPRPFMPGSQNVWVTWIAGYNPIPVDILGAALEWAGEKFRQRFQRNVASGGAFRPGMNVGGGDSGSTSTYRGMPYYVENVLQQYIQPGIGN